MAEKRKMLTPGPLSAVDPSRVQTPTSLKTVVSEGNPVITKAEPTQVDMEIMALLEHRALIEDKFDLRRLMDVQFKKDYSFEVLNTAMDRLVAEGSLVETDIGFELPHEVAGKPVGVLPVVKPVESFAAKDLREMGVEAYRVLAETDFDKLVAISEADSQFETWLDIASGDSIRGKRSEYERTLTAVLSQLSEKDLTSQMKAYLEQPPAPSKPPPPPKRTIPEPVVAKVPEFPVQCIIPKDVADALLYVLSRTDAPKVNVNALAQFIEDCSNE